MAQYTLTKWIFTLGVNSDQTPIRPPKKNRGLFFPETSLIGIDTSIMRKITEHVGLTLVYAHRFFYKGSLDNEFAGVTTIGLNRPVSDFVGFELSYLE